MQRFLVLEARRELECLVIASKKLMSICYLAARAKGASPYDRGLCLTTTDFDSW